MPIQFHHHTLPNGLTLIAEADAAAHTAAVGFFVRTGARDESREVMGVSHFLEHMMFKGTARRSANDVNSEFDRIGASYNAYTSHEQTVYYASILPEFLPRAVNLLGDMLRPALRTDDFEMEKNVILEEIGMYDDRPEWRLQDTMLEQHFGQHPLGYRVLGTKESIEPLTAEQMRSYFEKRYNPANIVVAAAGRIDFDALIADVENLCGGWAASDAPRVPGEFTITESQLSVTDDTLHRSYLGLLTPAPSIQSPQRFAARVLADILGDSEGSRLYWALIDPGLAEDADLNYQPQDGSGVFSVFATCEPGRAEKVEATLLQTLDAVGPVA